MESERVWRMIIGRPRDGYVQATSNKRLYYCDFWTRDAAVAEKYRLYKERVRYSCIIVKDPNGQARKIAIAEAQARYAIAVKDARNRREADILKAELKRQQEKRKAAEAYARANAVAKAAAAKPDPQVLATAAAAKKASERREAKKPRISAGLTASVGNPQKP